MCYDVLHVYLNRDIHPLEVFLGFILPTVQLHLDSANDTNIRHVFE